MNGREGEGLERPAGRRLAWAEYGDPNGRPLFYFHGLPGSRLEGRLVHDVASRRGFRVIAPDRPGLGRSGHRPGRSILDWPDDVAALADRLGFDRFSIVGVSGGAPYAAACACRLRERIERVGIVCGMGPIDAPGGLDGMFAVNRLGLRALRRAAWLAPPAFLLASAAFRRRPEAVVARLASSTCPADRRFFERPELRGVFVDTFREAFRQGGRGPAREAVLLARPWGFRLSEIRVPVRLWHGEQDRIVPPAMGRHVARSIPGCDATFYPDEGHFSLAIGRAEEMFDAVAS